MKTTGTIEHVVLPATLDFSSAKAVAEAFASKRGVPIEVDAGQVSRVGGLGVQVLLAAHRMWRAQGVPMQIINQSASFERDLSLLGNPLADES